MPKTLPNVREEILQTAREMLNKGADKICIRDIAKKCGIASGTFYNYFGSKQEVIETLIAADWVKLKERIHKNASPDKKPIERLRAVFSDLQQMVHNIHAIWMGVIPEPMHGEAFTHMQVLKRSMRNELSLSIEEILKGYVPEDHQNSVADIIACLFFSYSYEENMIFEKLRYSLEKLIG